MISGQECRVEKLIYTNEFLKNLEPFIVKNDLKKIQKIKEILLLIAEEDSNPTVKSRNVKLENIKTKTNDDIFMTEICFKQLIYNLFWTIKDSQKIIITLTKETDKNFMVNF